MDKIPYQLVPLFESSEFLADIADNQESLEQISDQEIAQAFYAKLVQQGEVDRVIEFLDRTKAEVERLKAAREYYSQAQKRMESLQERLKDGCKSIVEQHTDEFGQRIPFQGKLGKLAVQNSQASVKYEFDEIRISEKLIQMIGIPDEYLRKKTVFELDKKKIKEDLIAEKFQHTWAWLEQGNHLRIRK